MRETSHTSLWPPNALAAKHFAQVIAHGPIIFQAARVLRDSGILRIIEQAGRDGASLPQIAAESALSEYGVRVLLEAGLGLYLLSETADGRYCLEDTGHFLLNDSLTRTNMDFVQDVCYKGMFHLETAIREGRPAGLAELGGGATVYEALAHLPENIRQSWFAYDHFFSDRAFPEILPDFYRENRIRTLLDIGGNTGKWTELSLRADPQVRITLMDLPGQIETARRNLDAQGLSARVDFCPADVLAEDTVFPAGFDAVWMSQFLDCFCEADIVRVLQKVKGCLNDGGSIWILEAFWDRQRFDTAAFCLQQLSLYFTAIANGRSQMYDSRVFGRCIAAAGLEIVGVREHIGISHTLLQCRAR